MNIYERTAEIIKSERRAKEDEGLAVWQAALRQNDALYEAFRAYQADMIKAAQKQENTIEITRAALSEACKAANTDRDALLNPPYNCDKCKDTGRVGGKYCSCVIKRVIERERENLALPPTDFGKAKSTAPSPAIKKAYAIAEEMITEYPDGEKKFLILTGASGTGKTILASAITDAMMKLGASAVTTTAFAFVRRALDYHTQFNIPDYTDLFTPMLDCDLLVIDDLGTENILKNVTAEYLYTVINERWLHGKYTVVTTNLTPTELGKRYGMSITSRLCDKNKAIVLSVDSKNARLK